MSTTPLDRALEQMEHATASLQMTRAERDRFERLLILRTRQYESSNAAWIRAAERAIATGDMHELRERIETFRDFAKVVLSQDPQ